MDEDYDALLRAYLDYDDDAFARVSDMARQDPEACWLFVGAVLRAVLTDGQMAYVAAGPVEDMLKYQGFHVFDRVAATARTDPKMRRLLSLIWPHVLFPETQAKVIALRAALGIEQD